MYNKWQLLGGGASQLMIHWAQVPRKMAILLERYPLQNVLSIVLPNLWWVVTKNVHLYNWTNYTLNIYIFFLADVYQGWVGILIQFLFWGPTGLHDRSIPMKIPVKPLVSANFSVHRMLLWLLCTFHGVSILLPSWCFLPCQWWRGESYTSGLTMAYCNSC